jgi:trk system potassium uptake protein TrkA
MKIVILGAGQVGGSLAEHLVKENYDVTLVDLNQKRLQELHNQLDIQTIHGSASHPDVLISAGTKNADMLIAVTSSDEVNMLGCFIAHHLFRTPNKIARVRAQSYHQFPTLFDEKGIALDVLISPESLVKNHIEKLLQFPGANEVLEFANGLLHLVVANPKPSCRFLGKSLKEFYASLKSLEVKITAIFRQDKAVPLDDEQTIEQNDEVHFITSSAHTHHALVAFGQYEYPCQRIIIGGAGNIGKLLATSLESHYKIKVIDHNYVSADALSNQLNHATVLQGDIGDRDLLLNENIENTDCFIAVTNDDEANIMSSLQAKKLGAKHALAIINRRAYVELIDGSTIDHAISPQLTTIGSILTRLRKGDMVTVHSLRNGDVEAIEVIAHGDANTSKVVGHCKEELSLPPGCDIFALTRAGNVQIVTPKTVFQEEDHLILTVMNKRYLHQVEQLFQVKIDYF